MFRNAPRSISGSRWFVAGLIVGVLSSTVLAASIGFSGTTSLGVGSIGVESCDSEITVEVGSAYDISASTFTVSDVTLLDIADTCALKTLRFLGVSGTVTAISTNIALGPAGTAWSSTIILSTGGMGVDQVQSTALEIRD